MAATTDVILNLVLKADQFTRGLSKPVQSLDAINRAFERITAGQLSARRVMQGGIEQWQIYDNVNKRFIDTQTKLDFALDAVTQAVGQQITSMKRAAAVGRDLDGALLAVGAESANLQHLTGSANFAVLSLGQAFQDSAQFGMGFAQGMRAITNNIQQTAQAMILMATQAKQMGISMKTALVGSIMGPGGALLAMGLITAAIELFSNRSMKAGKDAEELASSFSDLFKVMQGGEAVSIATPQRLKNIADRYRALEAEQNKIVDAGTSVVIISDTIQRYQTDEAKTAQALAHEYRGFAEELDLQVEAAQRQADDLEARARQLGINGIRVENLTSKNAELAAQLLELVTPLSDEAAILDASNKILQDRIDAIEELRRLQEDLIGTTASRMSSTAAGLEDVYNGFIDLEDGALDLGEALLTIADLTARTAEDMRDLSLAMEDVFLNGPKLDDGDLDLGSRLETEADRVDDAMKRINASITRELTNISVAWASGVADIITGAQRNPIHAVLGPIAEMAVSLGKVAVATGITLLGIRDAFKSMNPWVAIAAGTALITLGKVVQNRIKQAGAPITGASGGSGAPGVSSAPTFFTGFGNVSDFPGSSPSFPIVPLNQQTVNINLSASGRDLVGVIESEASASQRRIGGGAVGASMFSASRSGGILSTGNRDNLVI